MGKNYLQMEVGGEMRGLKFSNRTLNLMEELSGTDPLAFSTEGDWKGLLNYSTVILCAAIQCNQIAKKETDLVTLEQAKEWMADLSMSDITRIAKAYQDYLNPSIEGSGEADKDTQGITLMAAS